MNLPPDGFADENGPPDGFADDLPSRRGNSSIFSQAGDIAKRYSDSQFGSPSQLLESVPPLFSKAAGKVGEFVTENISKGRNRVDPYTAAAVGTTISMAPDIMMSGINPGSNVPRPALKPYKPSGATTKVISSIFGPSQEAVAARFANPESIRNAGTIQSIAEDMPSTVKTLSDQLTQHAGDAYGQLSQSFDPKAGAIPKELVAGVLSQVKRGLQIQGGGVVGPAANKADAIINGLIENVSKAGPSSDYPYLSERSVKDIVNAADQNINWEDPSAGPINNALKDFRVKLDGVLKDQNLKYGELMVPVAEKTDLLEKLRQGLGLKNEAGRGLVASDTTGSKINTILNDNKISTHKSLGELKKYTGRDVLNEAQNAKYAEQFQPGKTRPNGSRRVAIGSVLGAGVGKLFGSPIAGSMFGAGTGMMLDTQGGAAAGKIIDSVSKNAPSILNQISPSTIRVVNPVIGSSAAIKGFLSDEKAREYWLKAGKDKQKAREMAIRDGWKIPS